MISWPHHTVFLTDGEGYGTAARPSRQPGVAEAELADTRLVVGAPRSGGGHDGVGVLQAEVGHDEGAASSRRDPNLVKRTLPPAQGSQAVGGTGAGQALELP